MLKYMQNKKEKQMKFLVDIDDVLRDLLINMVRIYNREFDEKMTYDDVSDYDVRKSFPKVVEKYGDVGRWFFSEHGHELFIGSNPIEGSIEAIEKLSEYGTIHIVTKQSSMDNKIDALKWLEANNIRYDSISFVKDKSIVCCDFFIDDFHDNFIGCGCEGSTGVLIDAPYNRWVGLEELKKKTGFEKIVRYKSIKDFANDIEKFL